MFKIGDSVLYGLAGIYDIKDITTLKMTGVEKDRLYYVLHEKNGSSMVYIPVNGDVSKMRKLISKEEAEQLISQIAELEPLQLVDEKKPEAEYKKAMESNDCVELFKLIKCIYFRKENRIREGKKIAAVDEKYMRLVENVLYQEIGVVLDIPKNQVLDYLIKEIEKDI